MAARFIPLTLLLACVGAGLGLPLYAENADNTLAPANPTSLSSSSWAQLNDSQKHQLLEAYKNLKPLDTQDQQDLQQRLDWFSQLPKAQQQRMREVWQNMSPVERDYWKAQLKIASPEQREELRNKIMAKYD